MILKTFTYRGVRNLGHRTLSSIKFSATGCTVLVGSLTLNCDLCDLNVYIGLCLFNLLVRFVSSRLQQFQIRLKVAQGLQPILSEGNPGH